MIKKLTKRALLIAVSLILILPAVNIDAFFTKEPVLPELQPIELSLTENSTFNIPEKAVSNITSSSARLNFNLTDSRSKLTTTEIDDRGSFYQKPVEFTKEQFTVTLYYGRTDGGTNHSSWENSQTLNGKTEGIGFIDLANLKPDTQYYYRYFIDDGNGGEWTDASMCFMSGGYSLPDTSKAYLLTINDILDSQLTDFPVGIISNHYPRILNLFDAVGEDWQYIYIYDETATSLPIEIATWETIENNGEIEILKRGEIC